MTSNGGVFQVPGPTRVADLSAITIDQCYMCNIQNIINKAETTRAVIADSIYLV